MRILLCNGKHILGAINKYHSVFTATIEKKIEYGTEVVYIYLYQLIFFAMKSLLSSIIHSSYK